MPFKKEIEQRKIPLTSLIDIIFLVLIFFLVSSLGGFQNSSGAPSEEAGLPSVEIDLPRPISSNPQALNKPAADLLIRIQKVADAISFKDSLYFYLLDKKAPTVAKAQIDTSKILLGLAGDYASERGPHPLQNRSGKLVPGGLNILADRLDFIQNNLKPYPRVEIMAYRNTKFSSIVEIFKICRIKGINEVKFWVLKGKQNPS